MRKTRKIMLICMLMFFSLIAYNQRFNAGILLGGCASHLTGSFVDSTSTFIGTKYFSKIGLNVGAFTNLYVTEKLAIGMEISYIQKGSKKIPGPNDTLPGIVYQNKMSMHYISIPIYAKYDLTPWLGAFVGPDFGILLGYKYTQNYLDFTDDVGPFSKLDFSLDIGVNVRILRNLSLNVKYSSTFFLTPVRSYNNPDSWKFGPLAKQFWQRGQCNQLVCLTLCWTIFGREDIGDPN